MALSIKTPENYGYEIAELFGTPAPLLAQAKSLGVLISQLKPGDFTIKHPKVAGTISTIFVKGQAITLAKNGAIGPGSKNAIADQFSAGLKKAIEKANATAATAATKFSQPAEAPVAPLPQSASFSDSVVKLSDATKPYQKVAGTSPASVYRVFALYPKLKLACRLKGDTLSIRAEGPGVVDASTELINGFGMEVSKLPGGGQYISGHYSGVDAVMFRKALGAVIGCLGTPEKTADLVSLKGMF